MNSVCTYSPTQLGCSTRCYYGLSCLLAFVSTTSSKTSNLSASIFGHGSCESYPVVSYPMLCMYCILRISHPWAGHLSAIQLKERGGRIIHSFCKCADVVSSHPGSSVKIMYLFPVLVVCKDRILCSDVCANGSSLCCISLCLTRIPMMWAAGLHHLQLFICRYFFLDKKSWQFVTIQHRCVCI